MTAVDRLGDPGRRLRDLVRRHGAAALVYVVNFGVAKALAFAAPLALAALLPSELYGAAEIAQSAAQLLSLVASLGVSSAVPQLVLLRRPVPVVDLLAGTFVAGAVVSLAVSAVAFALGWRVAALAFALLVTVLAQGSLSAWLRSFSWRNVAVWTDALGLYVLLIGGLAALAARSADTTALQAAFAAVGLGMLAPGVALFRRHRAPDLRARLSRATRLGFDLTLYSIVMTWVTAGGRFVAGWSLPVEDVAVFAFAFRVAAVVMAAHVFLATALFVRIYRMRARPFDRFLSFYAPVVAALCAALCVVVPLVLPHVAVRAVPPEKLALALTIFPLVAAQAFGWTAGALLESRLNRYRLSARGARWIGALAFVTTLVILAATRLAGVGLFGVVALLTAQTLAFNGLQLAILARRGIVYPRATLAIAGGYAAIGVAGLVTAAVRA